LTSIPNPHLPVPKGSDKWAHFLVYAMLGVLVARAVELKPRRAALMVAVVVGVSLFGAFDEWHQYFIPGRFPDVMDWLADSVGGAVGATMFAFGLGRRQTA
jgi:VanZ family protein